jgi:hypothetical protein
MASLIQGISTKEHWVWMMTATAGVAQEVTDQWSKVEAPRDPTKKEIRISYLEEARSLTQRAMVEVGNQIQNLPGWITGEEMAKTSVLTQLKKIEEGLTILLKRETKKEPQL